MNHNAIIAYTIINDTILRSEYVHLEIVYKESVNHFEYKSELQRK